MYKQLIIELLEKIKSTDFIKNTQALDIILNLDEELLIRLNHSDNIELLMDIIIQNSIRKDNENLSKYFDIIEENKKNSNIKEIARVICDSPKRDLDTILEKIEIIKKSPQKEHANYACKALCDDQLNNLNLDIPLAKKINKYKKSFQPMYAYQIILNIDLIINGLKLPTNGKKSNKKDFNSKISDYIYKSFAIIGNCQTGFNANNAFNQLINTFEIGSGVSIVHAEFASMCEDELTSSIVCDILANIILIRINKQLPSWLITVLINNNEKSYKESVNNIRKLLEKEPYLKEVIINEFIKIINNTSSKDIYTTTFEKIYEEITEEKIDMQKYYMKFKIPGLSSNENEVINYIDDLIKLCENGDEDRNPSDLVRELTQKNSND